MFNYPPPAIVDILNMQPPEELFNALIPAVGLYLECDRCFLYLREPTTSLGGAETLNAKTTQTSWD